MTRPHRARVSPEADSSSEDEPSLGCMCRLLKAELLALDEVSDGGSRRGRKERRKRSGQEDAVSLGCFAFSRAASVPCDLQASYLGALCAEAAPAGTGTRSRPAGRSCRPGWRGWCSGRTRQQGGRVIMWLRPPPNQIINIVMEDSPLVWSCRSCFQVRRTWGCCLCCPPGGKEREKKRK